MHLSTFADLETSTGAANRDVLIGAQRYTLSEDTGHFSTHTGNILSLAGHVICSIEKSFLVGGKVFHKVKLSRGTSNHDVGELDYQLKEGMTYIIDEHGSFVNIPGLYKTQKITDIFGKIPLFGQEYFMSVAHTGQTYLLDGQMKIKKDARGRDIRNIFKIVRVEGKELIFCEVFEYGKGITNTVLKKNFSPLTDTDGKEVICIKKYDFSEEAILLEVENEDGRVGNIKIQK